MDTFENDEKSIFTAKCRIVRELSELNRQAVEHMKSNGVEANMLNAVRENMKFLFKCLDELR